MYSFNSYFKKNNMIATRDYCSIAGGLIDVSERRAWQRSRRGQMLPRGKERNSLKINVFTQKWVNDMNNLIFEGVRPLGDIGGRTHYKLERIKNSRSRSSLRGTPN